MTVQEISARDLVSVYSGGKPNGCHCGQGGACGTYSTDRDEIATTLSRVQQATNSTVRYRDAESIEIVIDGDELVILYLT
jgi:hypothetical protein